MKIIITDYESEVIWKDAIPYNAWVRAQQSTLGNYRWGVTNIRTGKGGGGFADSKAEAKEKARKYIEEKLHV